MPQDQLPLLVLGLATVAILVWPEIVMQIVGALAVLAAPFLALVFSEAHFVHFSAAVFGGFILIGLGRILQTAQEMRKELQDIRKYGIHSIAAVPTDDLGRTAGRGYAGGSRLSSEPVRKGVE